MADFPYTLKTGSIKGLLDHIKSSGVPPKVSVRYLESSGFKTKSDRQLIGVLKFINFLDSSGAPTSHWQQFRSRDKGGGILARALKTAYKELFNVYPDANRKDTEALRNYFSTHTKVGEVALKSMIKTFRALCVCADFAEEDTAIDSVTVETPESHELPTVTRTTSFAPVININIELGLPPTDDPKVFEALFAAMKKYLLSD